MTVVDAAEAAARVRDGATVAVTGAGGGMLEADAILAAIEARFLATGHPRGLTVVHAMGLGDRDRRGLNRLAHEGLVAKVIGGHWVWSPRMQALARAEAIEAYSLPGGVIAQLYREIAGGRPGLITTVGLGTFVDPRLEGGRMNVRARDDLVEVVRFDGRDYLRYRPFPIDVAIVRGSVVDADGNVSLAQEGADLEVTALATAARNSGGIVLAQVRGTVAAGTLPARSVPLPAALVDAVVVDPTQWQTYDHDHDPAISGERRMPEDPPRSAPFTERAAIARRAALELFDGAVVNYGFGIPDGVARLVAERGHQHRYRQTLDHGIHGGSLLDDRLFGFARNPTAIIDSPAQFDFYGGGGLDIAFLGFGEVDAEGNVNVSKLGGVAVGPGGFMDIANAAKTVVFCGTMEAKGLEVATGDGRLRILHHGTVPKFVARVEQVTFSGRHARERGQRVLYVTERAVFRLEPQGPVLTEVAPGVDPRADVIDRVGFQVATAVPPIETDAGCFKAVE